LRGNNQLARVKKVFYGRLKKKLAAAGVRAVRNKKRNGPFRYVRQAFKEHRESFSIISGRARGKSFAKRNGIVIGYEPAVTRRAYGGFVPRRPIPRYRILVV